MAAKKAVPAKKMPPALVKKKPAPKKAAAKGKKPY